MNDTQSPAFLNAGTFTLFTHPRAFFVLCPISRSQVCLIDTVFLWVWVSYVKMKHSNKYLENGTSKILHCFYHPMGGHSLNLATHDIPVLCTAFEDFSSISNIII